MEEKIFLEVINKSIWETINQGVPTDGDVDDKKFQVGANLFENFKKNCPIIKNPDKEGSQLISWLEQYVLTDLDDIGDEEDFWAGLYVLYPAEDSPSQEWNNFLNSIQ